MKTQFLYLCAMLVEIDNKSGFCYGVVKTIKMAEDALAEGLAVYCLGDIVHNEEEVERLKSKGLLIINREELQDIHNAKILIRAHGEPPATYQTIENNTNFLTDGTCPIVLQLQKKVRTVWEEIKEKQGQVIIYGKEGHAEVKGLVGQTEGHAIVVDNISDLEQIDFSKPVALFAQTTQPPAGYEDIANAIRQNMMTYFQVDNMPLKIVNSICGYVSKRGEHLAEFSKNYEVVIFVSGINSSNGKVLVEICRKNNSNTYLISKPEELNSDWFNNVKSVGICGATSTPQWLMENILQKIKDINFLK